MKKVISGILCMLFFVIGAGSAQAASLGSFEQSEFEVLEPPIVLYSQYTNTTNTIINISGTQATSEGSITGYSGVTTKVTVALYLERKLASATIWSTVDNGSKTTNGHVGAHQLKTTVTKGYQYRVRSVYTAYSGTKSESLTSYSRVVTF